MSKIKVTLVRSTIGCIESQKANIKALGLTKIGAEKIHNDTPVIRGMIAKVTHLVRVEEVKE
ncbi:MAG: 50S ribosomal protein L30 [Clostridia bacterium]